MYLKLCTWYGSPVKKTHKHMFPSGKKRYDIHVLNYTHISTTHHQAFITSKLITSSIKYMLFGFFFLFLFLTREVIIVLCPIKYLINDIFNTTHLCFSILNTNILLFTNYSRMHLTFILFYEKFHKYFVGYETLNTYSVDMYMYS